VTTTRSEPTTQQTSRPEADRARQRTRRRFARRQWARRWMRWKLVVALVLVLGLLITGVWLVFFSAAMSVRTVEVAGNQVVGDAKALRIAAVPEGAQLVFTDLADAERRLETLAEVKSAEATRAWPDGVLLTITERQAVAVVELGGRIRGLDSEGVVFRDYKQAPANLPTVRPTTSTGTDALKESAAVVSALPEELAARVDHVEVTTIDQITLALRDGRQVQWGSAEESDLKARVLDELLAQVQAPVYDVSVPGSPVTKQRP